jgi:hypothetical protein
MAQAANMQASGGPSLPTLTAVRAIDEANRDRHVKQEA